MYTRKCEKASSEALRSPLCKFLITGYPRTGSSHLASLLDSHPEVACWDDEVFGIGEAFDRSAYQNPTDFVRGMLDGLPVQAVGFKWLWREMCRFTDAWEVIKALGIRVVHTTRHNYLDSYISYQLAAVNASFTSSYGNYKVTGFTANYAECFEWFEDVEYCDSTIRFMVRSMNIPAFCIDYAEICSAPQTVLDFLSVYRCPMTSRLVKQRKLGQSASVVNYRALKERFQGTKWSSHFLEP